MNKLELENLYWEAVASCHENEKSIKKSKRCGCYECGNSFSAKDVTTWGLDASCQLEEDRLPPIAVCPHCFSTGSVYGDATKLPLNKEFLKAVRNTNYTPEEIAEKEQYRLDMLKVIADKAQKGMEGIFTDTIPNDVTYVMELELERVKQHYFAEDLLALVDAIEVFTENGIDFKSTGNMKTSLLFWGLGILGDLGYKNGDPLQDFWLQTEVTKKLCSHQVLSIEIPWDDWEEAITEIYYSDYLENMVFNEKRTPYFRTLDVRHIHLWSDYYHRK